MSRVPSGPLRTKDSRGRFAPIGLAENPHGLAFQCGTCEYYDAPRCENSDSRLKGKHVEAAWCCNRYDNPQMKVHIR